MDSKKKIIIAAGVLGTLFVGYFAYQHILYVTTDNAQIEAPVVMLAAKVPGYIIDVKIVEGQRVKQGDILVQIDGRDYENTLKQVESELLSLESRRRDAEKSFSRISSLYKQNVVSSQQYDTATANYSEVKSKYQAVSAQVDQAKLNLENTKIKAPVDGAIAKKAVEVGQLAASGVPLIGFVGDSERWVMANFKETDIESIKVGSVVEIDVDAISGRKYYGTVSSLSSATGATFTMLPPDNATGNFTKVVQRVPVKIKLEKLAVGDLELLRAGLSAFVKVKKN
ncbi:MAG: HlyD family secretion protein [Bdellovibrionaceae bacterium]|nr:HlyD family secretion protein [Pseudobdellovibrionaceae bacterium]